MESTKPMVPSTLKRSHSEFDSNGNEGPANANGGTHAEGSLEALVFEVRTNSPTDTSSEDDDFGPALPTTVPKKKRRKLPYEKLYISALPSSPRYSKSLMHKDQLAFVTFTPFTDFLITSSIEGTVKFWKKGVIGIESVKEFKAHNGQITSVSASQDGRSFATAGVDKTVKIFDVVTFGKYPCKRWLAFAHTRDRSSLNHPP